MADCNIGQYLLSNSNVIGAWLWKKSVQWDPWDKYVERKSKDLYTGYNMRYQVVERLAPTELVTSEVTQPDGTSDNCDPPTTAIKWPGITAKTLIMDAGRLITPTLCLKDLRDATNAQLVLDAFVEALQEQRDYVFYRQHQARFTAAAQNKVVVRTGSPQSDPVGSTSFPAVPATGTLTYNRLKYAWTQNQQQGGQTFPSAMVDGAPVYKVFIGYEARENILRNNEALRTDIRFGAPQVLLDQLGKPIQPYRDFEFEVIKYPARWNFVGGAWVEVLPFLSTGTGAATVGVQSNLNPAYQTATYEDCYIWNKETYQMAVPVLPPVSWGRKTITFTPQNYNGDWKFLNIQSSVCVDGTTYNSNLFGDKVFGVSQFEFGSVIPRPEFGWVFRYKRCGYGNDSIVCES